MWSAWCSALPGPEILRRQLQFWGQVQGVGFRYRARWAAQGLGLTGWVQNLPDGSVLMQVQGPESDIDRMILQIEAGHYVRIENLRAWPLPPEPHEYGFSIRED